MTKPTAAAMTADIVALLRARNPLIWIVSREEARVEASVFEAAAAAGYVAKTWDVGQGLADMSGRVLSASLADPGEVLKEIAESARATVVRGVWVLRDMPPWLTGPGGIATCRQVRNLARMLPTIRRESAQAMIIISPSADVPAELANHTTVIEWPLPDRAEIAAILDSAIASLPEEMRATAAPNGTRDQGPGH